MLLANPLPRLEDGRAPIQGSGFKDHLARSGKRKSKTPGVDLHYRGGMPDGTPVLAAAAGVVSRVEATNRGTVIEVEHGNGIETVYRHLRSAVVAKGQVVVPGQVMGEGSFDPQDAAKTVHLHFELLVNGRRVDPAPLLDAIPVVAAGQLPVDTPTPVLRAALAEIERRAKVQASGSIAPWLILLALYLMLSSK